MLHIFSSAFSVSLFLGFPSQCWGFANMVTKPFLNNKRHSSIFASIRTRSSSSLSSSSLLLVDEIVLENLKSSKKQMRLHPYFIENKTNVKIIPTKLPPLVWSQLVPVLSSDENSVTSKSKTISALGVEVTSIYQDPHTAAEDLLFQCGLNPSSSLTSSAPSSLSSPCKALNTEEYQKTFQHLVECLSLFQHAIADSSQLNKLTFRARIVSSRGPVGTRCPRWHMDHVPLRLIMSLEGPGVRYLQQSAKLQNGQSTNKDCTCDCEKKKMNKSNTNTVVNTRGLDTSQANKLIRSQYFNYDERQAKTGDAMLLLGKTWEDLMQTQGEKDNAGLPPLQAVVHKSPDIAQSQGRVLLTVDVVLEEEDFY